MSVVRTDEWLLDSYHQPLDICEKIKGHFHGASPAGIHRHLTKYGMYQRPIKEGSRLVEELKNKHVWEVVEKEERQLQRIWRGPDVPIFILPTQTNDRGMKREHEGKAGVAFHDKIFLFISGHDTESEIRALLTHEYNHVCRLSQYRKSEEDYVLLDTMIMEGLAENAVRERIGEDYVSSWTSYYSNEELERIWKTIMLPNTNMARTHRKHDSLLYGRGFYPKMAGYCVGYYLVKNYMEESRLTCKDLMNERQVLNESL
ncbi:DUF2268 domain-containing protein [Bacillus sp. B190/17]|uniref:DUF2268 domain-containing protein n=1 Tax=Bacillus lumedeiriae TaxID=3058829 RepID=A0ABW8I763_9BACI